MTSLDKVSSISSKLLARIPRAVLTGNHLATLAIRIIFCRRGKGRVRDLDRGER